jgi:hypothetical protein
MTATRATCIASAASEGKAIAHDKLSQTASGAIRRFTGSTLQPWPNIDRAHPSCESRLQPCICIFEGHTVTGAIAIRSAASRNTSGAGFGRPASSELITASNNSRIPIARKEASADAWVLPVATAMGSRR